MPKGITRKKLFAKHGVPPASGPGSGSVTNVISTDNTVDIVNGTTIPDLSIAPEDITVVAAQTLVTGSDVVPNKWYRITDSAERIDAADRILVQGATTDRFAQSAYYYDSVNNVIDRITYVLDDTPTDLVTYREDKYGNKVSSTTGILGVNFPWGNSKFTNNVLNECIIAGTIHAAATVTGNYAEGSTIDFGTSLRPALGYNRFITCQIDLNTTDTVIMVDNHIMAGTTLDINQDSLVLRRNTFLAAGTFTFTAITFYDSVVDCDIRSSAGTVTTGNSQAASTMDSCKIYNISEIDLSIILNTSLYMLTTDEGSNNIFIQLDMTDETIYETATETLAPVTSYPAYSISRNFILTGESGARIHTISPVYNGCTFRFQPKNGNNYIFEHVARGAAVTNELCRAAGAGDLTVTGYAAVSDFIMYEMQFVGSAVWMLKEYTITA